MTNVLKTALVQMRISPHIKRGAELVLNRMGLNTSEAVELYMRYLITEKRLPFEVVAVDRATLAALEEDYLEEKQQRKTPQSKLKPSKCSMPVKAQTRAGPAPGGGKKKNLKV